MNKSEHIDKLAQSLSKLQNEIQNAYKDKSGYGYKYVELSSILDLCRPLLVKYELAVSQLCDNGGVDPDIVGVETLLMHSSGQYISSTLYMRVNVGKGMSAAQAAGSCITYCRRYALAAILSIAQTDNDAAIEKPKGNDDLLAKVNVLIEDKSLHNSVDKWCEHYKVAAISDLTNTQLTHLIKNIEERA